MGWRVVPPWPLRSGLWGHELWSEPRMVWEEANRVRVYKESIPSRCRRTVGLQDGNAPCAVWRLKENQGGFSVVVAGQGKRDEVGDVAGASCHRPCSLIISVATTYCWRIFSSRVIGMNHVFKKAALAVLWRLGSSHDMSEGQMLAAGVHRTC